MESQPTPNFQPTSYNQPNTPASFTSQYITSSTPQYPSQQFIQPSPLQQSNPNIQYTPANSAPLYLSNSNSQYPQPQYIPSAQQGSYPVQNIPQPNPYINTGYVPPYALPSQPPSYPTQGYPQTPYPQGFPQYYGTAPNSGYQGNYSR